MAQRLTTLVATALALGLAVPASAQGLADRAGNPLAAAQATGHSVDGYNPDGTLNVFGANLDPAPGNRGGLVGNVVGGTVGGVTGLVGGTVGAAGNAVGAAGDIVTGSIAPRATYTGRGY